MALVAVAFTACEKTTDVEKKYDSTIDLTKTTVQFTKNGGEEIVDFTIKNPVGGKVTAEETAEESTEESAEEPTEEPTDGATEIKNEE